MPPDALSAAGPSSPFCRICHEADSAASGRLLNPCLCRGTQSRVHAACIGRWVTLRSRARDGALQSTCEVCRAPLSLAVEYPHPARFLSVYRVAHLVYIGLVLRRFVSEVVLVFRLARGVRLAGRVSRRRLRILLLAIVRGAQYCACLGLDVRYLLKDFARWSIESRTVHVRDRPQRP